ncbi:MULTISPECIES: metal transporter [Rhodococcus]|uniref:metal transporter n=1 Tax=Rhodococcus TaxID=1827 RepID=UPI002955C72A|nr:MULTISPECIES: metal transporter [Rhodococcus]MDV7347823.1 metal transporter [Rhodococcus oxybenzonivorans]MDV8031531.1 metal transporter [Rhodococcus sp. IEGM 27]
MSLSAYLTGPVLLPARVARRGLQAGASLGTTLVDTTVTGAVTGAATVAGVGMSLATAPLRGGAVSARDMAREFLGGAPSRRYWCGFDRIWMEVRGLDTPEGSRVGTAVLAALRALPGVSAADLNYALSRVIVTTGEEAPSLTRLCDTVCDAENLFRAPEHERPLDLPGDDVVLAGRVAALVTTGVGLGVSVAAAALRLPRLPAAVAAAVISADYQPRIRRIIDNRLGPEATDVVLATAGAATLTLTQNPASLAVSVLIRATLTAETWSARQAWQRSEPALARRAGDDHPPQHSHRPRTLPVGPVERHATRSAFAAPAAAVVAEAATGDLGVTGAAVIVAAPAATRTARESFAATLGRGLADRHAVLPLRPQALRRLDRVDAVVIDPQILPPAGPDAGVLTYLRRAGIHTVSLRIPALGDGQAMFDELHEPADAPDTALHDAVEQLQSGGATVAVIAAHAPHALAAADVGIGVVDDQDPPWYADLLVGDPAIGWRILCAVPAARTASRRGVELSTGSSLLGAVLLLTSIPFQGAEPVLGGAAAGLWIGHRLARRTLDDPLAEHESDHTRGDDARRTLRDRVHRAERFAVALPGVGHLPIPTPEQTAYLAALTTLAALGILEWPVALVIAAGYVVTTTGRRRPVRALASSAA